MGAGNEIAHQTAESPREIYELEVGGILLLIFRTVHIPTEGDNSGSKFWSTGLLIDGRVLFTADTRFDPLIFEHLPMDNVDTIFHDCQLYEPSVVHASYDQLKTLDAGLRSRMHLTHYGDTFQKFDPSADGFAGFVRGAGKPCDWFHVAARRLGAAAQRFAGRPLRIARSCPSMPGAVHPPAFCANGCGAQQESVLVLSA